MALLINGVDGRYSLPNVLSRTYKYAAFEPQLRLRVTSGGVSREQSIDVKTVVRGAWGFITGRAAKYAPCNDYFKALSSGVTLQELLEKGDITLHCLEPKGGHSYEDLPLANSAGRDMAIHPSLLTASQMELACTLIHELAHVAGATTNPAGQNAGAAELALKSCLCKSRYNPDNLGLVERVGGRRFA